MGFVFLLFLIKVAGDHAHVSNISITSVRASSGYPDTEKQIKARG